MQEVRSVRVEMHESGFDVLERWLLILIIISSLFSRSVVFVEILPFLHFMSICRSPSLSPTSLIHNVHHIDKSALDQ